MKIINFMLIIILAVFMYIAFDEIDKLEKDVSTLNRPAIHSLLMAPNYEGGIDAYMASNMIPMGPINEFTGLVEYLPLFSKVNELEGMIEGHIDDLRVETVRVYELEEELRDAGTYRGEG